MAGGTLVVSRSVNNHAYYKQRFEALRFANVTVTALENDGLDMLVRELKPDQIIMGARFYEGGTPFRLGELKKRFPKIYMAAVATGAYPDELGRRFIDNKINAYANGDDGVDQFHEGLEEIRMGRGYVAPSAQKELDRRRDLPKAAGNITQKHRAVINLICNGYTDKEVAEMLYMSERTVANHKTAIYTSLDVRNCNELIRAALTLGLETVQTLSFYPKNYALNPLPEEELLKREAAKNGNGLKKAGAGKC